MTILPTAYGPTLAEILKALDDAEAYWGEGVDLVAVLAEMPEELPLAA